MTDDPIAVKRCRFIARQVIGLIDTIDFSDMDWYDKEDLLRHISENDVLFLTSAMIISLQACGIVLLKAYFE